MKPGKVSIRDLRIKAPGLTTPQARQLGHLVAQRLLDAQLASDQVRLISSKTVRLTANRETSITRLADEIVSRIRHGLD